MVGYPNTGKSSIINTLRKKKVCVVAPIAGETKVWQYITLMKRIYMIDCPGIVPPNQNDTDQDLLLRGSVRVENVEYPAQYIEEVLKRVQPRHLQRTYDIKASDYNDDAVAFLELLCRKSGRLLKGGEADIDGAAKMVLNDWIRGKLPWFTPPPYKEGDDVSGPINPKREGLMGEMSKKRKRGGESEAAGGVAAKTDATGATQDESDDDDDDFSGFSDEDGVEMDDDDDDDDDDEEESDDMEGGEAEDDEESEDDAQVEEELAAITQALAKAKKRQKTT
jgi:nuclear GTP-binding protein